MRLTARFLESQSHMDDAWTCGADTPVTGPHKDGKRNPTNATRAMSTHSVGLGAQGYYRTTIRQLEDNYSTTYRTTIVQLTNNGIPFICTR